MATSTLPRQQFAQQRQRASDTAQQGYEELRAAARAWSGYLDVLTNTLWGHRHGEPAAAVLIDRWFDMVHHMLDAQRQFSKSLLPMTTSLVNATYRAADETTRTTREAAQATTDHTAQATREAGRTTTTSPSVPSAGQAPGAGKTDHYPSTDSRTRAT